MQEYFAVAIIIFFVVLVIIRSLMLKRQGFRVVEFGKKDKKDFLLPPFVLFYFYLILANAFGLPSISGQEIFYVELVSWIGVALCFAGAFFFVWALISFKNSFRVGLAENSSQGLITSGAFSISRNPIYVAFTILLIGQFLVFPSWILLIYIFAGIWLFNRQILKEEAFLREQYGREFLEYCKHVRRWI